MPLFTWPVALIAGAGLMFFLDPDRGQRRRELLRDKGFKVNREAREELGGRTQDLENRFRGMLIEMRSLFGGAESSSPSEARRTLPRADLPSRAEAREVSLDSEPVGTTTRPRSSGPAPTHQNGSNNPLE